MTVAHQPSIIALTEVKPKNCLQRLSISEISILGYCTHSNIDDQEDSNRGIVIYVKEELSHQVGNIYFKTDFNEQVWISIKLKKSDELIFGCLYRSPKPNTDNHSSLLKLIEEANQRNSSHMVLVGDFNYPGIDWNNLTATRIEEKQFLESVCDNFLCQHVEEATRHSFLTNRRQHVRIPGGVSKGDNVLSGVPQGTVLGPVLFLVLISDISSNVSSNITSFADDTKVFATINDPTDCDNLQSDLDNIYLWSSENNMMFNQEKFQYISYHMGDPSKINNIYLSPDLNILPKSGEVKDLGILMSENCDFDNHIATVVKKCSRLCGWILRTFSTRSKPVLLTLFKSLVIPHLDYGSQLWSPFQVKSINALERVQRVFTKHIDGMHNLSYAERLKSLGIYSLQRRRDRYMAIYMWKILERKVPNFSPPIQCHISDRRGRLCSSGVVPTGHLGTLCHNSFRNRAATLFNCLPKHIRNIVNCANPIMFKRALDNHLCSIEDSPMVPNECNSLNSRSKEKTMTDRWRAAIADQAE